MLFRPTVGPPTLRHFQIFDSTNAHIVLAYQAGQGKQKMGLDCQGFARASNVQPEGCHDRAMPTAGIPELKQPACRRTGDCECKEQEKGRMLGLAEVGWQAKGPVYVSPCITSMRRHRFPRRWRQRGCWQTQGPFLAQECRHCVLAYILCRDVMNNFLCNYCCPTPHATFISINTPSLPSWVLCERIELEGLSAENSLGYRLQNQAGEHCLERVTGADDFFWIASSICDTRNIIIVFKIIAFKWQFLPSKGG